MSLGLSFESSQPCSTSTTFSVPVFEFEDMIAQIPIQAAMSAAHCHAPPPTIMHSDPSRTLTQTKVFLFWVAFGHGTLSVQL